MLVCMIFLYNMCERWELWCVMLCVGVCVVGLLMVIVDVVVCVVMIGCGCVMLVLGDGMCVVCVEDVVCVEVWC